ncbi:PiggyBac transposable element-derived protein 4 [Dictyocoela muelleri]|nr:PiggyBac transposable element-derived protein 4 [Dictyocoela muelleri]
MSHHSIDKNVRKNKYERITKEDLYAFLAILLILGINNSVNVQHCWNKKKPFSYNKTIKNLMSFDKFQFINKHLTCISDKDIAGLKLKKCPKIIKGLEELFKSIYVPGEHISIDEGMLPFKGKTKNRVYSPMKLDKWGMKFYILAESSTGFVYNLRIVGEQSSIEDTVIALCNNLVADHRKIFMDNYYNSYKLCNTLLYNKIYSTGTLRHKRGGPQDLLDLKKRVIIGDAIIMEKNKTQILIWQDRKPVVVITNCYNCFENVSIKKREIPKVINEYNKYMGGVDKFDQMIKYYPLKRKTNRWTQKFTIHIFDLLIHNSYVLYKKYSKSKPLSHYDYIEKIIMNLIERSKVNKNDKLVEKKLQNIYL